MKFSNYAIEKFSDIKGTGTIADLTKMVYGGLMGWCMANDKEQDFTSEELSDWVDEIVDREDAEDVVAQITTALIESKAYQTTQKKSQKMLLAEVNHV